MSFLRTAYYMFPPGLRRISRRVWYFPVDLYDAVSGRRNPMVPPRGRIFIGSGDFITTGEAILKQLVTLAGLQPFHRILDVGCGIGRVAVPLTAYLDGDGSYEGFDIVPSAIRWCRNRITSRYPRFRFTHTHLKNDLYNMRTHMEAKNFIFPYTDGEFDLVFLTSVFTHMLPDDIRNYLAQIHRVLKLGGTCFATFFLVNREAEELMEQSEEQLFTHKLEHHYLHHPRVKEANVAYEEDFLLDGLIRAQGFRVEQLQYGFWPGRPKTTLSNYQDICVFRKI